MEVVDSIPETGQNHNATVDVIGLFKLTSRREEGEWYTYASSCKLRSLRLEHFRVGIAEGDDEFEDINDACNALALHIPAFQPPPGAHVLHLQLQ